MCVGVGLVVGGGQVPKTKMEIEMVECLSVVGIVFMNTFCQRVNSPHLKLVTCVACGRAARGSEMATLWRVCMCIAGKRRMCMCGAAAAAL